MSNIEQIKDALLNIQALYALLLGTKKEHADIEQDVNVQIAAAKALYEADVNQQQKRLAQAGAKIKQAEGTLKSAQDKAYSDLGIVVDMEPVKTGGHTRL